MLISTGSELVGRASIAPDDDVFVHLAKVYSNNHASMHQGDHCSDSANFPDSITNGYQWYRLQGQHTLLYFGKHVFVGFFFLSKISFTLI